MNRFQGIEYQTRGRMLRVVVETFLFAGGLNRRKDVLEFLSTCSPESLAKECIEGWDVDVTAEELAEAIREFATTYVLPDDSETEEFIDWLREFMAEPDHAESVAAEMIRTHDWTAGRRVEIPSRYMRDGNPATYTF